MCHLNSFNTTNHTIKKPKKTGIHNGDGTMWPSFESQNCEMTVRMLQYEQLCYKLPLMAKPL